MAIGVYKNVPKTEITSQRYTSEGKPYNLDHNEELVVDMKFKGQKMEVREKNYIFANESGRGTRTRTLGTRFWRPEPPLKRQPLKTANLRCL